ncbi:hypothetical protein LY78DRAFT_58850 [Colletotrichum sublineola]|nr:hypothetical protein LY78DRAFT_58850 [Colletotrichum sublineola]
MGAGGEVLHNNDCNKWIAVEVLSFTMAASVGRATHCPAQTFPRRDLHLPGHGGEASLSADDRRTRSRSTSADHISPTEKQTQTVLTIRPGRQKTGYVFPTTSTTKRYAVFCHYFFFFFATRVPTQLGSSASPAGRDVLRVSGAGIKISNYQGWGTKKRKLR